MTNTQTGIKATTKTDAQGVYRFNNILVGIYTLVTSMTGFGNTTVKNIAVEASVNATINVTMQIGATSSSVTVVESAPPTDAAGHQALLTRRAISECIYLEPRH